MKNNELLEKLKSEFERVEKGTKDYFSDPENVDFWSRLLTSVALEFGSLYFGRKYLMRRGFDKKTALRFILFVTGAMNTSRNLQHQRELRKLKSTPRDADYYRKLLIKEIGKNIAAAKEKENKAK